MTALWYALYFLAMAEGRRTQGASELMFWVSVVGAPLLLIAAVAMALAAFTVFTADSRRIAAYFVLGSVGAFIAFPLLARLLMLGAAWVGKPKYAALRLALANLHRPGAPTPIVMLSLGLGLTVLVATALIEGNLREQLTQRIPGDAPAFFFVDIQDAEKDRFDAFVREQAPGGKLERVPMLRGRIISIKGVPSDQIVAPPDIAWILNGDRGITDAEKIPDGSQLIAGEWWPADYAGPPLVSIEEAIAT
eukprot:gene60720-80970_t